MAFWLPGDRNLKRQSPKVHMTWDVGWRGGGGRCLSLN